MTSFVVVVLHSLLIVLVIPRKTKRFFPLFEDRFMETTFSITTNNQIDFYRERNYPMLVGNKDKSGDLMRIEKKSGFFFQMIACLINSTNLFRQKENGGLTSDSLHSSSNLL